MAGAGPGPAISVRLAGAFHHAGDLWRLSEAAGEIDDAAFAAPRLEITEGASGQPDEIVAEIDFTRLDLNALFGTPPDQPGGEHGDADMPLTFAVAPDPHLRVQATAQELAYAELDATEVRLVASAEPGRDRCRDLQPAGLRRPHRSLGLAGTIAARRQGSPPT